MEKAERHNEHKNQLQYVPVELLEEVGKVFTKAALSGKYEEYNYRKGLPWTEVLASLKRHIISFEKGKDFDDESGELHMAHAAANAAMLLHYYVHAPHFDDRYVPRKNIGLDIDGVLANFTKGVARVCEEKGVYFNEETQRSWNFKEEQKKAIKDIWTDHDFWLSLEPMVDPSTIRYEPICYITHRPIPSEISQEWLDIHNFPNRPVYTVNGSKVEKIKEQDLDIFIDDAYHNYIDIENARKRKELKTICYLMSRPWNLRYEVGFKRIYNLNDVI